MPVSSPCPFIQAYNNLKMAEQIFIKPLIHVPKQNELNHVISDSVEVGIRTCRMKAATMEFLG